MPDDLFLKIFDDLTEIPPDVPFYISPFKISDPLVEKRLPDLIEIIEGRLPGARLWLATNGSALNESNIEKLSRAKRSFDITVSLTYIDPEAYEREMGLPFYRTVDN